MEAINRFATWARSKLGIGEPAAGSPQRHQERARRRRARAPGGACG
jgi:hypothetical protein